MYDKLSVLYINNNVFNFYLLSVLVVYDDIVDLSRELLQGNSELLQLPTDKALLEDPEFRRYVELYAKVIWILNKWEDE